MSYRMCQEIYGKNECKQDKAKESNFFRSIDACLTRPKASNQIFPFVFGEVKKVILFWNARIRLSKRFVNGSFLLQVLDKVEFIVLTFSFEINTFGIISKPAIYKVWPKNCPQIRTFWDLKFWHIFLILSTTFLYDLN